MLETIKKYVIAILLVVVFGAIVIVGTRSLENQAPAAQSVNSAQ